MTGLDAFLSSFSASRGCSRNLSPSRLPLSPMYNVLQRVHSYTVDGIGRDTGKMISDLNGSLGPRQFLAVANERTCFWNALLTKKLLMFLSRLNEINGGCQKILPVWGSV